MKYLSNPYNFSKITAHLFHLMKSLVNAQIMNVKVPGYIKAYLWYTTDIHNH